MSCGSGVGGSVGLFMLMVVAVMRLGESISSVADFFQNSMIDLSAVEEKAGYFIPQN